MLPFRAACLLFATCVLALGAFDSVEGQEHKPTVLAHYMAWYESKPVSGAWGWHWTMGRFDPETIGKDGQRSIASHDTPLIGPYDSGDDNALECQALLMKFAGIDGVVIDWYGTADFRDYAMIHRNAQRFIVQLKKAGLRYAICYEDQSVKHMIEGGRLQKSDEISEGTRAMKWLAENCFADPAYVKSNDRPVLLIFGPQQFSKPQLQTIFSDVPNRPLVFGLPHLFGDAGVDGAFGWPPVSGGREIGRDQWLAYLKQLHARDQFISVTFPAFHDIYKEAGLHDSYGFIDAREGKTFSETLELALRSRSQIVQIATWNDYGEGTVIEPTVKNGYRYLEGLQKTLATRTRFTADDLRLPVDLFHLRIRFAQNPAELAKLKIASDSLFAGNCEDARKVLEAVKNRGE